MYWNLSVNNTNRAPRFGTIVKENNVDFSGGTTHQVNITNHQIILDNNQTIDSSERVLITKDNKEVPILKSVVQLRLDDEDVLLEAFADITERKRAERDLEKLNVELEDTVKKLEQTNNELNNFVFENILIMLHPMGIPQ